MATLVEGTGQVSLYRNSDGTFSAVENGVSTFIKDYGQPATPTTIPNLLATDYFNGYRVVVFDGGHTWYVDSDWQKARVGPGGVDTTQLSSEQIAVLGTGVIVNPIYTITPLRDSVTEGQIASFDLATMNVAAGTQINYALMGVTGGDIAGGSLTGSVVVDGAGHAIINVPTLVTAQSGNKSLSVSLSVSGNWVSSPIALLDAATVASGPLTSSVVERIGQVVLNRNSDGTFSAVENGVSTFIKDYGQPATPTHISNIVAADYFNGYRVVVFDGGHTWYVDSDWQKARVGPGGADTTQMSAQQIAVLGTGVIVNPVYTITPLRDSITEGQIASFDLATMNVASGTQIQYALLGVTGSDIVGGSLTGFVTVDGGGHAIINVPTQVTALTGNKNLSVSLSVSGNWVSNPVALLDASTVASGPLTNAVVEGIGQVTLNRNSDGTFSAVENGVSTFIKDYGQPAMPTRIPNIVAADYFNGYRVVVFDGGHTWYVDSNWQKARVGPSGADTAQLSAQQIAVLGTGTVIDPTYTFTTPTPTITEGQTATFNLRTVNVMAGTEIAYALLGVDASDISGGRLTGSVAVDFSGNAVINVPTAINPQAINKNLSVSLSVSGNWVSGVVAIRDNATNNSTPTGPASKSVIESVGQVVLESNSDGTFSALENGFSTYIKDYGQPATPTRISNIIAADYIDGHRVVVFNGGHTWYVDSNWQKAPVGPNGADVTQLSTDQIDVLLGGGRVLTKTLVEGSGRVSLYSNSDGTFSASENGVSTFIKDYGQPATPTRISNIVAADYYNGYRVVTFFGGHTWYVDSNWQKAAVGPNGADVAQLTAEQISTMVGGSTVTNPVLVRSLVRTTAGVSLFSDSNGTFSVLENGSYNFVKDVGSVAPTHAAITGAGYLDGARIIVLAGGGSSGSTFWYADASWSKAPVGPGGASEGILSNVQFDALFPARAVDLILPTYNITVSQPSINEGEVAVFNLSTTNLAVGTKIDYALMGVDAGDIAGGNLAGSVVIDNAGQAVISIPTLVSAYAGNKAISVALSVSGNVVSSSLLIKDLHAENFNPSSVVNTATIDNPLSQYDVSISGTSAVVIDIETQEITAVFDKVQRIDFADLTLGLDIDGTAGQAYRLYRAAFDREPDYSGLGYWLGAMDKGIADLERAAQGFINSDEFRALNAASNSNNDFITKLYQYVLHRTPDEDGYRYWNEQLSASPEARAQVLAYFSDSPENIEQVAELVSDGIQYTEYVGGY
jgi:hypothetical protein